MGHFYFRHQQQEQREALGEAFMRRLSEEVTMATTVMVTVTVMAAMPDVASAFNGGIGFMESGFHAFHG